jgi:hypothetical protein
MDEPRRCLCMTLYIYGCCLLNLLMCMDVILDVFLDDLYMPMDMRLE